MNGAGTTGILKQKMEVGNSTSPHTEINSKVIKDLNAMTKTITFVEENQA